ncbi:hypothetical protein SBOR_6932 [Sclerotinia borealis F-4128]|uniref:Ubiquitin-like domain-containing protein n=1 Tax=Sclerotinia borealis (strain F-4128) TaxID=1432307 RepID=W9C9Y7_SCLBF|nr:hypothetical protein SBOR_6932 [Sclerotinia borealis F-4128]
MAYYEFPRNAFSEGDDEDDDSSVLVAEAYRPCKTLYVTTTTGTITLPRVSPIHRIESTKATLINTLMARKAIPHPRYECAISYAGRELEDTEKLESCRIGDEATVNALLWQKDCNTLDRTRHMIEAAGSSDGLDDGQKAKSSKRVRSVLDLSESEEDDRKPDTVLKRAPASKKHKSVRFADEGDDVIYPPPPSLSKPSTSRTSSPKEYVMSGGLKRGNTPDADVLDFHDSLVRNVPARDHLPRRQSIEELSRNSMLKSPSPFCIHAKSDRLKNDSLEYPSVRRDNSRRELYINTDGSINPDYPPPRIEHRPLRIEDGISPTAVRSAPQNASLKPLTSNLYPAVRNTIYLRPPGTRPASRPLPRSSKLELLDPSHASTSPSLTHTAFPRSQQTPSAGSSKDSPLSYPPQTTSSPLTADLLYKRFHSLQAPTTTPKSILKPSCTPSPQLPQPSSTLQPPISSFSKPSRQSSKPPSALQKLNSYFTKAPSPPLPPPPQPKYPLSRQTPLRTPSYFPQPTIRNSTTSDYFQAAPLKITPSHSKLYPPHPPLPSPSPSPSPSPPPPPRPHSSIKPPSPPFQFSHRPPPPPSNRSDNSSSPSPSPNTIPDDLQDNPPPNSNSRTIPQSKVPPSPPFSPLHFPRLHSTSLSPLFHPRLRSLSPSSPSSASLSLPKRNFKLPHLPLFYNYFPSPLSSNPRSPSPPLSPPSPPPPPIPQYTTHPSTLSPTPKPSKTHSSFLPSHKPFSQQNTLLFAPCASL